ncbi:hypothetical protein jhhlp_007657 [Lomentospora prolificans]|uniref:MARVEL domain-containing protein n=1 Tax=Lomentospora prolificans TaxID=41688 RepID=A0A2N3N071_9PEZI|nr:hypothetical protein jhhlp_007657 [Lomentospora prolificans]
MDFGFVKTALRVLEFLWCLLLVSLLGNVIASERNASTSANAAINFSMFVAVLAWLATIYGLLTRFVPAIEVNIVSLVLDGLATLFTFINAIVLAAKLRAVNCGNLDHDSLPKNYIAWGSANDEKRCREIQASTAFMWFLFACFAASLFFTWRDGRRGYGGGSFISRPSMAQVGV